MFLSACREVSKEFPNVRYDEEILDRVCLQVLPSVPRMLEDFTNMRGLRSPRTLHHTLTGSW